MCFKTMKKLFGLIITSIMAGSALAAEPENNVPASTDTQAIENVQAKAPSDEVEGYDKWRLGSYGEMLAAFKDYGLNRFYGNSKGNTKKNHNEISIPRFIVQGDYKITPKWILTAEIEFEAGGTGIEYEIESQSGSENGEYETELEKGGEVALEQFHLTRLITPAFNIRVGHMIMPVGLTNSHHEPLNFFTAARPEGATTLMASTWHETGIAAFGRFGRGTATFDYEAMITAGLNPNGFDCYNWIKKAKQGFLETDNFSAPAYTARLNWTGVKGLRVGASVLYNPKAGKNSDKLITYDGLDDINILLYSFDAQYVGKYVTARANYFSGNISETVGITAANRRYSSKSPYSRMGPVAKRAVDWSAEIGFNLKSFFPGVKNFPVIYPFAHYNYYNPQEECEEGLIADKRCQVSMWSAGINWRPLPNLVVKADYTTRQIGTKKIFGSSEYNSENEFRLGVAYMLWFDKK